MEEGGSEDRRAGRRKGAEGRENTRSGREGTGGGTGLEGGSRAGTEIEGGEEEARESGMAEDVKGKENERIQKRRWGRLVKVAAGKRPPYHCIIVSLNIQRSVELRRIEKLKVLAQLSQ
jgi:hypothetical protein